MFNLNYVDLVVFCICYDFINFVGVIVNGVEFFEMMGGVELEIELIFEGIFYISVCVWFFCIVFGVSDIEQIVLFSEIKFIFDDSWNECVLVYWWVDQLQ